MIAKIMLLCGTIGLVQSGTHSRYPRYHDHKERSHDQRLLTNPQLSSLPEEPWGRDLIKEESLNQPSTIHAERDDDDAGNHQLRNENWCSSVQTRLVTYIAACKTEKYVIKSQQPCPNGTPDCQKIMYRAALTPVYQVKQKVVSSLHWKCCPGYFGKDCEHHDPNVLPVPTNQAGGWEEEREAFSSQRDIIEAHQSHEAVLEDLQNDIHQATNYLGVLQNVLHSNISSISREMNLSQSEDQARLLQQMLIPYVESFLQAHFNPVWTSFNRSLQDLSTILKNLSQNIEANRKSIENFQEGTVPRKEFQELGTKFESKIQENLMRMDQMKRDVDYRLHTQQAAMHYNLTMIKADTDMRLKRYHKMQHSYLLALNNSVTDMRQQQAKFQDELEVLNRNIAVLPIQFGGQNEEFTETDFQVLNQTLVWHSQQLKDLYEESDEAYKDFIKLQNFVKDLQASSKHELDEFKADSIEKSLIIEEYKEDLEMKLLALNNTLANLQESHWDLQRSMKECCGNLTSEIDMEEQRNITQMNREEIKPVGTHLKDFKNEIKYLPTAFPHIHQSLGIPEEQNVQLEGSMSLESHAKNLSETIDSLKKHDEKMHRHIKYLNSSFNSLLEDAMRHETALEALLGEEIMEVLSEENPSALISSIDQLQMAIKKQNITLGYLMKRIHSFEMDRGNNSNPTTSPKHPVLEKQIEDTVKHVSTQHGSVEHMEPNHEAAIEDALDNALYQDIVTLKKEIGYLSKEMKKYTTQWDPTNSCCNHTIVNLMDPLSVSVDNLREDIASTQQTFEEHLQIFQKLFGSNKQLAAANVSLDVAKIQSMMGRKMRKQPKVQERQKMRDKKEVNDHREGTLNGRNTIHMEVPETGSSVAFYARFPDVREATPGLNRTYLNYGGGYFPEHGYFKSPHTGVYMVAISMEFTSGAGALGQLAFHNGHKITLISNKKKANGSSVTRFILVELKKGEHMWFELRQGTEVRVNPAGMSMAVFLVFKT